MQSLQQYSTNNPTNVLFISHCDFKIIIVIRPTHLFLQHNANYISEYFYNCISLYFVSFVILISFCALKTNLERLSIGITRLPKRPLAKERLTIFRKTDLNDHSQTAGHSVLILCLCLEGCYSCAPSSSFKVQPSVTTSIWLILILLVTINWSSFIIPSKLFSAFLLELILPFVWISCFFYVCAFRV